MLISLVTKIVSANNQNSRNIHNIISLIKLRSDTYGDLVADDFGPMVPHVSVDND